MKKYLVLIFILLVLVQWYVPGKMMWSKEEVLKQGKVFHFLTEPVDPEDPLRGRYVSLEFKADTIFVDQAFKQGETAYAELGTDAAGFALLKKLHKSPPPSSDYVEVTVAYQLFDYNNKQSNKVVIDYPFEKFFMDEYKAPEAELLYQRSQRDTLSAGKTFAVVSIYKGKGVTRDLVINNRPVRSYFK